MLRFLLLLTVSRIESELGQPSREGGHAPFLPGIFLECDYAQMKTNKLSFRTKLVSLLRSPKNMISEVLWNIQALVWRMKTQHLYCYIVPLQCHAY